MVIIEKPNRFLKQPYDVIPTSHSDVRSISIKAYDTLRVAFVRLSFKLLTQLARHSLSRFTASQWPLQYLISLLQQANVVHPLPHASAANHDSFNVDSS